ncbi:hypothetical protein [Spirosoma pulveris]
MNKFYNKPNFSIGRWLLFSLVVSITLGFALYTNHAWEDWYITFRASKNLAMGNGLVFTPGEHLHTFTSPLGTLIPALLSYGVGPSNDELVLWLFRLVSATLLGFSAMLLLRCARKSVQYALPVFMVVAVLALDAKIIDYSINGMETAFMVFFLSLLIYALIVPLHNSVYWLALAIAGLMWSRPDSFVYIGSVMTGIFLFNPQSRLARSRAEWLSHFVRAGLLGLLMYLPWVACAWWYYGTPIPNTITAKGLGYFDTVALAKEFILFPITSFFSINNSLQSTYGPAYMSFGGWNLLIPLFSKLLTFVGISYWMLPFARRAVRPWSFAAYLAQFYLSHVIPTPYPWYVPSVTVLCTWALALEFNHFIDWVCQKRPTLIPAIKSITVTVIGFQLVVLVCVAYQMRVQQQLIETSNRKNIGLWLSEHAKPGSTVYLECLGYIGFYSNMKMYDFPGLSSKEVVEARKTLKSNDLNKLVPYLKPDYLVLRPVDQINTSLKEQYVQVKRFDVSNLVNSYSFLPGRGYLQFDQTFTVYKRKLQTDQILTLK